LALSFPFQLSDCSRQAPADMQQSFIPKEDVPSRSWRNFANLGAYVVNTTITYASIAGTFGATNVELSKKYQTLVTPAGWAFAIWGPIFIWEGVFAVAQMLPSYCSSKVVLQITPWWLALCFFQVAWTLAFSRDLITLALIFMLCILASLLGVSWSTDGLVLSSAAEYFLLRAPMSLQLGWIIAASAVNASVEADAARSSQEVLLALAVLSYAAVLAIVAIFTFAVRSPDPFVGCVAAWAFLGIYSELGNPENLNDPARFNPSTWNVVTLGGLRIAAGVINILAAVLAVVATVIRVRRSV